MKQSKKEKICPSCEEEILEVFTCKNCTETFLICEECESIFMDYESALDPEYVPPSLECPHCSFCI